MILTDLLSNKPVLVGLHLGFAIVGIDLLLWHLGELVAGVGSSKRLKWVAVFAAGSFGLSWFVGGYYYVKFYGSLVKPVILKSAVPWAHAVVMESKEHIFLFILPLALTILYFSIIGTKPALLFAVKVSIWAELAPPLKDWLKSLSGHHWTSKSYLPMLVYVVVFAYCYSVSGGVSGGKG